MADLTTGIEDVRAKVSDALRAAEADSQASPVSTVTAST